MRTVPWRGTLAFVLLSQRHTMSPGTPRPGSVQDPFVRQDAVTPPSGEGALRAAVRRAHAQLEAIGIISQAEALLSGDVEGAARLVTELASEITGCERVNVWLFDDDEVELRCVDAFEATPRRHSSGMVLHEDQYAAEFRAIKESRYVAADDPLTDPRTAGYVESYLRPLRITSMLDVVVHASGRNFGLLCFEHVDRAHHWEQDEITFACQLADKVALALVNRARRQAEATLRENEEKYRRLVESTTDCIWEVDAAGTFTYVSPRMVELFGCGAGDRMSSDLWSALVGAAAGDQAATPSHVPGPVSMAESTVTAAGGTRVVLESSGTPIFDGAGAFSGYRGISRDVTLRYETTQALKYRDAVLHAVMTSATELVAGASLIEALPKALAIVGRAIDVDRVLVYRLDEHAGTPSLAEMWRAGGRGAGEAPGGVPAVHMRTCLPPLIASGVVTTCADAEGTPACTLMRALDTRAFVLVPVTVGGTRWGCILVDDRTRQRQWTSTEIDSLRTLSEVIGSLIAREAAQAALRQSELTFRTVTEAARDAIVMFDSSGIVRFWNPAAERILGYAPGDAIGRPLDAWLAAPLVPAAGSDPVALADRGGASVYGHTVEMMATRHDGVKIPVELSVAPMELGADRFAVGILRDISERKRVDAEMHRMARFDGLTGLANRGHFVDALRQAVARARRTGAGFAVLYLDIDHFKDVNDTLGHPVGDRLLQSVVARLKSRVREVDTIARFGGDEFAILQTGLQEISDAALLAAALIDLLARPFTIDGNEIRSGASIGIAIGNADTEVEVLLAHADIALYRSKAEGRHTFRFFTEDMDAEVRTRVALSGELRRALGASELFLLYQPQVDLASGGVIGLEALLRWKHPVRGVLRPGDFMPAAETSGVIVALGEWVLSEVCIQGREWLNAGVAPDVVTVNISPLQFKAPLELERSITFALADSGLPPERLELELTETGLMAATRDHSDVLLRLRDRGIRLSIDDFGTGYSSLDHLRRFPMDRIKIAQSFVSGMTSRPENAAIVKAALGLTRELNLGVIAEGVETAEECELLRAWGCPQAQGNHIAEPLSVDDAMRLLRSGRIPHVAAGAVQPSR